MMLRDRNIGDKSERGFTVVEIAIVLIIFGLVVTAVMMGLKLYARDKMYDRTVESVAENQTALFLYQISQGRYPCPADPTLAPTAANYGRSDCTSANLITVQGRDVDNADGDNNPNTGGEDVLIGAMPFNQILDPDNDPTTFDEAYQDYKAAHGVDGWGAKFTYAVTKQLTDFPPVPIGEIDLSAGAIDVVDEFNISVLNRPATAHFTLISHGETSIGAHMESGQKISCFSGVTVPDPTAPLTLPLSERENCDFQVAALKDAKFLKGVRNETSNSRYDDVVKFFISTAGELWTYTGAVTDENGTPADPSDDFDVNQIANTNSGYVGVGVDDPLVSVHVKGDLQAREVHAEALCDANGDLMSCLPPEYIGGEVPNMKCPSGQVVQEIGRVPRASATAALNPIKVNCVTVFDSSDFTLCPPGQFLTGISSKTGSICQTF